MKALKVDAPAAILRQGNVEDRERSLAGLRTELKNSLLSRVRYENRTVIAADTPSQSPVKPKVKLNVGLASIPGLTTFRFLTFFLEYLANVRMSKVKNENRKAYW